MIINQTKPAYTICTLFLLLFLSSPLFLNAVEFDDDFIDKFDNREFNINLTEEAINSIKNDIELENQLKNEFSIPMNMGSELKVDISKFEEAFNHATFKESIDGDFTTLPIGVTNDFGGGASAQLIVVNAYFTVDYFIVDLLAKVVWNGTDLNGDPIKRVLRLGCWGAKYYYDYGFQGELKLALLENVNIPIQENGSSITLNGNFNRESGSIDFSETTYLKFGCNGIKNLEGHFVGTVSIKSDNDATTFKPVELNNGKYIPAAQSSSLEVDFETTCSLNNFYFSTSIGLFTIGETDLIFDVSELTVDLSSCQSHENFKNSDGDLWQGFYVDQFTLYLPESISKDENGKKERVSVGAKQLAISETGMSGSIRAEGLTNLENGSTGNWPLSVDLIEFEIESNNITQLNLAGEIRPPVLSDTSSFEYCANFNFTQSAYSFGFVNVGGNDSLTPKGLDLFLADLYVSSGQVVVAKNESLSTGVEVSATLSGSIGLKTDKLAGISLAFTNFEVSNKPSISIETISMRDTTGGETLAKFPIVINEVGFGDDKLKVDMAVNLMKGQISGKVDGAINVKQEEINGKQKWQYVNTQISELRVKAKFSKFGIDGGVEIFDDAGNQGFSGDLEMTLDLSGSELKVKADAIFGTQTEYVSEIEQDTIYRYWHVDMMASGFKIPLMTGIDISGIGGGAAFHMKQSKTATFSPDIDMGLFLRANTQLLLAGSSESNPSNVALELQFNSMWGLKYIQLFGDVSLAPSIEGIVPGIESLQAGYQKIAEYSQDFQDKLKLGVLNEFVPTADDFIGRFPVTLDSATANVKIQMLLEMNFDDSVFSGAATTYVNALKLLKGRNSDEGDAGSVYMVMDKDEWFIHAGYQHYTENSKGLPDTKYGSFVGQYKPLGIKMSMGKIDLIDIYAYFLLGHHLPENLPHPQNNLGLTAFPDEGLDEYNTLNSQFSPPPPGAGLAFGAGAQLTIPPIEFFILYAELDAYVGFDVLLRHYETCICNDWDNEKFGLNNWYAQGQAYAGLGANIGVQVKVFGKKKRVPAIDANMSILLQAKLPNPSWFSGTLSGNYNILGGTVQGSFNMNCTFGDECGLIANTEPPSEIPEIQIVNHTIPENNAEGFDPFGSPGIAFNYEFNKDFGFSSDIDGEGNFKLLLDSVNGFYTNAPDEKLNLSTRWDNNKTVYFDFASSGTPWENETVEIMAYFSLNEKIDDEWVIAIDSIDNEPVEVRKMVSISFTPGNLPNQLANNSIIEMYPAIDQDYLYTGETNKGFVSFNQQQQYLFTGEGETINIKFLTEGEPEKQATNIQFEINENEALLTYEIPNLSKDKDYQAIIQVNENSNTINDILHFDFHTSKFTFIEDKLAAFESITSRKDGHSAAIPFSCSYQEPFGREEIIGNRYMNENKPLITAKIDVSQNNSFIDKMMNFVYTQFDGNDPQCEGIPATNMISNINEIENTNVIFTDWDIMEREMEQKSTFPFVMVSYEKIMQDIDLFDMYLNEICTNNCYSPLLEIVENYKDDPNECQYSLPLSETAYSFPLKLDYQLPNAGISKTSMLTMTYNL